MKILNIAAMFILVTFSLSMLAGVSAVEEYKLPDIKIPEKQLNVKLNHKFKIDLKSNPTTGYKWIVYYNHKSLKLLGKKYIPDKPMRCGSGGHTVFTFKALKKGNTDIVFKYVGPLSKKPLAKMMVYHVKIHR